MLRMRSFFILLLTCTLTAFAQTPTFSTDVSLVKIDAQVIDGRQTVTDLTQADFVVTDQGAPQEIVYFGKESEPLHVLLLLDVSGSMRKYVKEMAAASKEALKALDPGDEVGIMVFGRETKMRREFTDDVDRISNAILGAVNARELGAGTRINTSIIAAADQMRGELEGKPGRRAILILTDNKGLAYQVPNERVLRALFEADAVINAIAVGKAKKPKPPREGANPDFTHPDVFLLANETGGDVIKAKKAGPAFREILDRIRTRYSLHYRAPAGESGAFRSVEVALTAAARKRYPKAVPRSRSGYYVP
jgi:VWFA-related protein